MPCVCHYYVAMMTWLNLEEKEGKSERLIERGWEEFKRLEVLRRLKSSSKRVTDGKMRS